MKKLYLMASAFILSVFANPCNAQRPAAPERDALIDTDYDYALYGDVSSIKVSTYELKDNFGTESKGSLLDSHVIRFDSRGQVSTAKIYFGEGVSELCTYSYNSQGKITTVDHKEESGSIAGKTIIKYNSNGKKIQHSRYNGDGSLYTKDLFEYNSSGKLSREYCYGDDGSLYSKNVYNYGSNGKVSSIYGYDSANVLQYKKIFSYDQFKNLIKFSTYDGNGAKIYEETYKYNSNGYMTSSTERDFMYGYKLTYKYKYDSKGNVIEKRSYNGDALIPERIVIYTISYR
jgi:hypothetical protein